MLSVCARVPPLAVGACARPSRTPTVAAASGRVRACGRGGGGSGRGGVEFGFVRRRRGGGLRRGSCVPLFLQPSREARRTRRRERERCARAAERAAARTRPLLQESVARGVRTSVLLLRLRLAAAARRARRRPLAAVAFPALSALLRAARVRLHRYDTYTVQDTTN